MEPAQILMTLLLIGAVGSVLLTCLFFVVASGFIECTACSRRISKKNSFCGRCGKSVGNRNTSATNGDRRSIRRPRVDRMQPSNDNDLHQLFQSICRLSPARRSMLNALLQQHLDASANDVPNPDATANDHASTAPDLPATGR